MNPKGIAKVYIVGNVTRGANLVDAVKGVINLAKREIGSPDIQTSSYSIEEPSPFDLLGFCTWSSIGENVLLPKDLLTRFNYISQET